LRASGYTGPIIALTAHALPSERQRCLEAGCDAFATKPIERLLLLETIALRVSKPPGE
jgi:CheY-like chemotaxis protein